MIRKIVNLSDIYYQNSQEKIQTAVYASAGHDTMVFTFTHPEFLKTKYNDINLNVGIYFLIDSGDPQGNFEMNFKDENTTITTAEINEATVFGLKAHCLKVKLISNNQKYSDRTFIVYRIWEENLKVSSVFRTAGFVPDLFVGVCDGCSFGGNIHCVNKLGPIDFNIDVSILRNIKMPKYWITDHFENATIPNPMLLNSIIKSNTPFFPFAFKKICLLSTEWGHYADGVFAGANLFEVISSDELNP